MKPGTSSTLKDNLIAAGFKFYRSRKERGQAAVEDWFDLVLDDWTKYPCQSESFPLWTRRNAGSRPEIP